MILEVYDRQWDETAKIFAEYHKRLCYYVNQARDSQKSGVDSSVEMLNSFSYLCHIWPCLYLFPSS